MGWGGGGVERHSLCVQVLHNHLHVCVQVCTTTYMLWSALVWRGGRLFGGALGEPQCNLHSVWSVLVVGNVCKVQQRPKLGGDDSHINVLSLGVDEVPQYGAQQHRGRYWLLLGGRMLHGQVGE